MKKMTWAEAWDYLTKWNSERGIKTKGVSKEDTCTMVAVITKDSFNKEYSEKSRSYAFTNDNKAFIAGQSSNSIFSECLDGTDDGVRLDWYVGKYWHVEYCYILDETEA